MKQLSLIVMIMITIMIMIMITIMIVIIIILLGSLKFFIHIVKKSTPRFTKSPSLVLIRLVLTGIQRFKNVKFNKEINGYPHTVSGRVRIYRNWHSVLGKF